MSILKVHERGVGKWDVARSPLRSRWEGLVAAAEHAWKIDSLFRQKLVLNQECPGCW